MYSKSIQALIKAFSRLPSVGGRTAERFVFHLLRSGKKDVGELTLALKELIENVKSCEVCWDFADASPCAICADTKRDHSTICVVSEPQDVQVFEKPRMYQGRYHVLRGTVTQSNPDSMRFLKVDALLARLQKEDIQEVVLSLNPDLPGETTMMFLEKRIRAIAPHIRISRLARGLPMGSDMRYADEITLQSAFTNRTKSI
ncbi:MAG: recombination protein RecR [Candidatus Magasanikbacteria bacterium CG10_big_fil_rev_8_21_14_0_10_43_6]|uniref:Recombination protein RecR n=1 Tax=Candidatus Magasanikbacteria bacterium CG10_big_fil_rev_8_21_14_0_10_43_6 TaxID=1974650 RepID=A0A2M6VZW7_9BACT|nr:MAG: recombination protein RecR [Candidatus Magasanikbacteria bacterium CG10_big_fil_rev_8_21_14_0_10_43_6]